MSSGFGFCTCSPNSIISRQVTQLFASGNSGSLHLLGKSQYLDLCGCKSFFFKYYPHVRGDILSTIPFDIATRASIWCVQFVMGHRRVVLDLHMPMHSSVLSVPTHRADRFPLLRTSAKRSLIVATAALIIFELNAPQSPV